MSLGCGAMDWVTLEKVSFDTLCQLGYVDSSPKLEKILFRIRCFGFCNNGLEKLGEVAIALVNYSCLGFVLVG